MDIDIEAIAICQEVIAICQKVIAICHEVVAPFAAGFLRQQVQQHVLDVYGNAYLFAQCYHFPGLGTMSSTDPRCWASPCGHARFDGQESPPSHPLDILCLCRPVSVRGGIVPFSGDVYLQVDWTLFDPPTPAVTPAMNSTLNMPSVKQGSTFCVCIYVCIHIYIARQDTSCVVTPRLEGASKCRLPDDFFGGAAPRSSLTAAILLFV